MQRAAISTDRSASCASSLCLILLFWLWQPMGGIVWDVAGSAFGSVLTVLYFLGWAVVLYTTFLIDHFDLLGLRQAWNGFRNRKPRGRHAVRRRLCNAAIRLSFA
jgi:hypothetical protein